MADPRLSLIEAELSTEQRGRYEERRRRIRRDSRRLVFRQPRHLTSRDPEVRRAVLRRDGHVCGMCERRDRPEVDHRRPLWAGGADTPENAWVLCPACHLEKTRLEEPWYRLAAFCIAPAAWSPSPSVWRSPSGSSWR